jgi:predicted nucleic acid-binding protein
LIAVDASSFRRYLEGWFGRDVELVDSALAAKHAYFPPAVVAELLSEPTLSRFTRARIIRIRLLPLLPDYWQRVGDLRASLLRLGRKAKLADCLIAQSCIDNDAPLITYDRDFRHFENAGLKLL